ncbi:hypothetical protein SLE2022_349970 [Rubroshorea leprosula]
MNQANNSASYVWKRKTQTERAKKIDRAIATYAGNSRWRQYGDVEKIKDDKNIEWGEKRSFRYIRDSENTEWLMREYILDSSRVEVGRDNNIAFCYIYMKRGGCPESPHVGSSDRIPQPDQMIQNAAASSSTLVVPSTLGTHSGDDTLSRMSLDYLQASTASFSTVRSNPQAAAVASCPITDDFRSSWMINDFSLFEYDQFRSTLGTRSGDDTNQMIQNAAVSSTTLEVPSPWGTHSGDDTRSIMNLDHLQSPTASFSAVRSNPPEETDPTTVEPRTTDIFSTLAPVDYLQSPWILDEFSNFEFDQYY